MAADRPQPQRNVYTSGWIELIPGRTECAVAFDPGDDGTDPAANICDIRVPAEEYHHRDSNHRDEVNVGIKRIDFKEMDSGSNIV